MKIMIESISSSANEQQVRSLFERFGTVESVQFVQDKHSGIPSGTVYVIMPSDDEAEQAIAQLNGTEFEGQTIQLRQSEDADFPTGDFW